MMEKEAIYTKNLKLLTNDVDFNKNIKPSAVLNIFQEIAGSHAQELGCGFEALAEQGLFWVLSRFRYEVLRPPVYGEEVTAFTWPVKTKRVYFERDYEIKDSAGNLLIRASSVWCVLNAATRSVLPANNLSVLEGIKFRYDRALFERIAKLGQGVELYNTYARQILPGDLDYNMHVNNTRYADYVYDAFDFNFLRSHTVSSLQIHYLKEGVCGKTAVINVQRANAPEAFIITGTVESAPFFQAQLTFAPIRNAERF